MTGLRERKKRETRLALSRATIGLIVERGWDEVAVEDIAAAANVSERTFRNYFSSKAEAVAASHLERALVVADELRTRPATEPLWPAVVDAARKSLSGAPDSPRDEGHMERVKLVLAHPSLHAELLRADDIAKDELAAAIADRVGLDAERDLFPQLAASVATAAIATAMRHWMVNDPNGSVIEALERAFTEIGRGLPVPEGES
ncbi:TetR/AcrR family transcriptional regulator [Kutzneria sp. CA-103260]|uniref:TetR/AcrR family transcriptional regulator n=1 Tax=Kutzneria sp. CA-103260 TaxID=2802641 RepID=UPI001BA737EE|nr:TetR family transcriptional regulator [Kutzneria sp. CA-103260]QUQ63388.1 TetR family transcriptional regulator [Kutzneria sp. CA-103260]